MIRRASRRSSPSMPVRGFTLLEIMMAVAIAGIITAAATTATVAIYRSSLGLEQASYANEEGKVIVDTLSTRLLQVGGGRVRPWAAISNGCFIDDGGGNQAVNAANCAGNGGTRLDLVDLSEGGKQVTLASLSSGQAVVDLPATVDCPLTPENGYPASGVDVVVFPTNESGGGWRNFRCTPNTATCACALSALGGVGAVDVDAVNTTTFAGGVLSPGRTISYELDVANHTLSERADVDGDGTVERRLLSDRVFDLRVQFGYDAAPEDGVLDDTWQTFVDTRPEGSAAQRAPTMRMARVGVVVGARVANSDKQGRATLFGNAPITSDDYLLRAAETAVTMRNLLVFF